MRAADAALLIVALGVLWSLYRAHTGRGELRNFNLLDLLMQDGKVSRIACAFMTTLCVTSWILIRLAIDGKLTEGYYTAYGVMWVAPVVARMFSLAPPPSTVTEESSSKKVTERT